MRSIAAPRLSTVRRASSEFSWSRNSQCPAGLSNATTGTPKGAKGVEGLGVDGTQVTVDGLPVYRYQGDSKKGQAAGEGISSFGGVWHVVTTDASASSSSGSSSSSSGRGTDYGY